MDVSALLAYCSQEGFPLSEERAEFFSAFGEALYERNRSLNLTRVPYEQCVVRHFIDSLLVASLIPQGANVVDVGTGPGFPAWPLACARADLSVTAMDGSEKGLSFLREHLLPNLRVVKARAEEWIEREEYDFVTGRALAPLAVQLEVSVGLARVGGLIVPMRTPAEIGEASALPVNRIGLKLEQCVHKSLPGGSGDRAFPVYRKLRKTPAPYPRRWAEIKANPLSAQ